MHSGWISLSLVIVDWVPVHWVGQVRKACMASLFLSLSVPEERDSHSPDVGGEMLCDVCDRVKKSRSKKKIGFSLPMSPYSVYFVFLLQKVGCARERKRAWVAKDGQMHGMVRKEMMDQASRASAEAICIVLSLGPDTGKCARPELGSNLGKGRDRETERGEGRGVYGET
jgi:hypothetical protein